jgi:hypothetical protein
MTQFNQQLLNFYKSRTIFNSFMIKNKYILIYLIILMLITLIFNRNIDSFKDLNIYNSHYISIMFNFVLVYITYIKFNILVRCLSFLKSIIYFYNQIILSRIKNIKSIALYYYIFNLFFMIISILFINNIHNNLYNLNFECYIDFTNVLSMISCLFYFIYILTMKFHIIDNDNINPLIIVLTILIIFIPFITFNFYYDKINIFDNYFKGYIIHCDPIEDSSFEDRLKDKSSIVITNNSNSPNIINNRMENVYINTPKDVITDKPSNIGTTSTTDGNQDPLNNKVVVINNIRDINSKFIFLFINSLSLRDVDIQFNDEYYNNFINKSGVNYKLDTNIIYFFEEQKDFLKQFSNNYNVNNNKFIINYIYKLYELYLDHNDNLAQITDEHNVAIGTLDMIKEIKHDRLIKVQDDYNDYITQIYYPHKKDFEVTFTSKLEEVEIDYENKIQREKEALITKSQNRSNKLEDIYHKSLKLFNLSSNKSQTSLNQPSNSTSSISLNSKTSLIQPSTSKTDNYTFPMNDNFNFDDYKDLFTKPIYKSSNNSTSSINSSDSDKTIKP